MDAMVAGLDGRLLGPAWVVPFIGLLLSVAVLPYVMPRFWHDHFGKVAAAWALAFLIPSATLFGVEATAHDVLRMEVQDFLPFLILVIALYTVTGGVRIVGGTRATPLANTGVLAVGLALGSIIGTTGAAMLLIRPLLQSNAGRCHQTHLVVFFIILVCNVGGALSPLGNPPLLLGFLQGVDFFWPARNLLGPTMILVAVLLPAFYLLDCWQQGREQSLIPLSNCGPIRVKGKVHLALLAAIVGVVLFQAIWRPALTMTVLHVEVALENVVAQALLVIITILSLTYGHRNRLRFVRFSWFPLTEVTKLFAAIFVTIIPVLAILHAGSDGWAADLLAGLERNGQPINILYFWSTGLLSSVLDNAPTYLIFFHAAGGDPVVLMTERSGTLAAISTGAVFMGALTYIGNAPNFLVKSIAEDHGVAVPSFFGYFLWSACLLIPVFSIIGAIFFR